MTHATFTPVVNAFRFYNNGTEAGASPLAAQDTNITVNVTAGDVIVEIRTRIDETGVADGATTDDWALQVSRNTGSFVSITSGTSFVRNDGAGCNLTATAATTNRATDGVSDPGSGSFVAGQQMDTGGGGTTILDHQLTANNFTEHVWGVELVSADLANADTLDFRITLNGGTPGLANNVTPRITVVKSGPVVVGLASETDIAQTVVAVRTIPVGLSSETDSTFAIVHSRTVQTGLSTETDTSFSITANEDVPIGLASETDIAFALGSSQTIVVGLSSETDTSFSVTAIEVLPVGLSLETDTAFTVTAIEILPVGLTSETDSTFGVIITEAVQVGPTSETDTAFNVSTGTVVIAVGLASEIDTAQIVIAFKPSGVWIEVIDVDSTVWTEV